MRKDKDLERLRKRWLTQPKPIKEKKTSRTTRAKYYYKYVVKPRLESGGDLVKKLDKIPRSVAIALFILFFFVISAVNNHQLSEMWKAEVISAYPELVVATTDEDGVVQPSPIDRLFVDFTSKTKSLFFVALFIQLNMFFGEILLSFNPHKPQSLRLKG